MRFLLKVVAIVIVLVVAYPAYIAYEVWSQSHDDEQHGADAIVVLGAAQYNGSPSPVFKARLDQAAYLYNEDLSDRIIVTGGKRAGDRFTESEAGLNYLVEQGIPSDAILQEPEGDRTLESLEAVAEMAPEYGVDTVLMVSDPLHSERLKRIAADLGFEESYTSFANYQRLARSRETKAKEIAREVGAIIVYELFGR
jgi:vancomycin permeability regulator SanA